MENKGKQSKNIISTAIMVIAIIALIVVYRNYNYNDFTKSVVEKGITKFTRDNSVKYSKDASYKIENTTYNDAMFYQSIDVKPNTPYKVTCKVKVDNVENQYNAATGGAHICIAGGSEKSIMISGTKDWQELTFLFNSKNREKVNIGFRLGGYEEKSKGTAWFTDMKMEEGIVKKGNDWKVGLFIFPKIDVEVPINGETVRVKLEMTDNDISDLENNIARFKTSVSNLSRNKMMIDYDTYIINDAIKTVSYDKENGYYVSPEDVYEYINKYIEENEYDHIYVGIRMADIQHGNTTFTNDWIGLGGMEYLGIGYSNIRLPDSENNYAYKYNYNYNTFPEEVYIHEFLHTLERNCESYGYDVPNLHDYGIYGYKEDKLSGQRDWYIAYMNKEIRYNGQLLGISEDIYGYKPVHASNFKYSTELDVLKEPSNLIEIIRSLFGRIGRLFTYPNETVNFGDEV